ncbi:MAG: hypothetical protein JXA71_20305, partial [Chitinispirillaceae bacterium]|nr:hypothetical protein [Chitinispirillaceae bacterium]
MIRKSDDLCRMPIGAVDGILGKVDDLYFDDRSWIVRYLAIDLDSRQKAKSALISPLALEDFDGATLKVYLTKKEVADCLDHDFATQSSIQERDHAGRLYQAAHPFGAASGPAAAFPFVLPAGD